MMTVQDNAHACMARPGLMLAYQLLLGSVPLRRALGERQRSRYGCASPELRFADQRAGVPTPLPAASQNPLANAPGASSLLRAYGKKSRGALLRPWRMARHGLITAATYANV
jgi:hypothetical protein